MRMSQLIPIGSAGTCKHHIGLDNVSCKQSTESFKRNDFNRNEEKSVHVNVPSEALQIQPTRPQRGIIV